MAPLGIEVERAGFRTAWNRTDQKFQGLGLKLKAFILTVGDLDRCQQFMKRSCICQNPYYFPDLDHQNFQLQIFGIRCGVGVISKHPAIQHEPKNASVILNNFQQINNVHGPQMPISSIWTGIAASGDTALPTREIPRRDE